MFSSQNSQVSSDANYIEDVFSTYLYTGNGSTQTITNGIDLSTKGGMVITKARSIAYGNILVDTTRGVSNILQTSTTNAQINETTAVTGVSTTGFSVGSYSNTNGNGQTFASWTFREQAKFFDVVTYTGNGSSPRDIAHSLGSVPGCIFLKRTDSADNWVVYHRSIDVTNTGGANTIFLNLTNAAEGPYNYFAYTVPTSTTFKVGSNANINGATYVAYLFAHNAGGFGLTGTDNVISCGSYTGNGSTDNSVTLGYEPQWIMIKDITGSTNPWVVVDNMRGMSLANRVELYPSSSSAELVSTTNRIFPTATGFTLNGDNAYYNTNGSTYIYIAIRRGPMKVPTSGTSVFSPLLTSTTSGATNTTGFPVDSQFLAARGGSVYNSIVSDRLRGVSSNSTETGNFLVTSATSAENTSELVTEGWNNTAFLTPSVFAGVSYITWNFGRAPSFFDEVCYTGTGANQTVTHNLGVPPELMLIKRRSGVANWVVYSAALGNATQLVLDSASAASASSLWQNTTPTASVFSINTATTVNSSGSTYVAYLFATCAGVSKVGRYSGTGSAQTINCGFTSGARFVLIKQDNSNSRNWYVWDSARGITSSNDPFLWLNTTDAENTSTNYVDTDSTGFKLTASAPSQLNSASGTYIFLAIA